MCITCHSFSTRKPFEGMSLKDMSFLLTGYWSYIYIYILVTDLKKIDLTTDLFQWKEPLVIDITYNWLKSSVLQCASHQGWNDLLLFSMYYDVQKTIYVFFTHLITEHWPICLQTSEVIWGQLLSIIMGLNNG